VNCLAFRRTAVTGDQPYSRSLATQDITNTGIRIFSLFMYNACVYWHLQNLVCVPSSARNPRKQKYRSEIFCTSECCLP